ncbi:hypothetical protein ACWT_4185 [Actinoplanes sp. SE50]|uniref:DUF998 domain-containing protein n=1 Tax=unclassified Actinoplanes TaxID=2626549 RepID=UPI00023EC2B9|nr:MULTISPECIES: DUF998 domain-containing protein [unclassified Actinoplanes]AEV85205.1 hypothetical protein ACPL_4314 [Actinoplanes sp. SE50/110]ATO83600.1 hypothetical protein ACWT_4185 [Actinoplanes sp. SE50]SLM01007.1 hypothetical protein ACSP50_4240 [Actinoplanes sp. SE50/110]
MINSQTAATAALIALAAYLIIITALHVLPTGYRLADHAVSDYGVGRYARLFHTGLIVNSLGVLALAAALALAPNLDPPTTPLVYLVLLPVARIGIAVFPTDLEGRGLTPTGIAHYLSAIAAFTLTYLAIDGLTPTLRAATSHPDVPHWLAIATPVLLAAVAVTMFRPLRRLFGVTERLFLLVTNAWYVAAALIVLAR